MEEVAKFRAARRMWARIMAERFGAKTDRARALRFHCQTAGMTLTAQQPLNNVARVTVQTLAAVLGGCQSLHTNSFDEALGLPTSEAVTIALRTQQIVAHESGVADFVDALGGSYAVEALTTRIEAEAKKYIARIDELGGMVARDRAGLPAARDPEHRVPVSARDRARSSGSSSGQNAFTQEAPRGAGDQDRSEARARRRSRGSAPSARGETPRGTRQRWRAVERAAQGDENLVPARSSTR